MKNSSPIITALSVASALSASAANIVLIDYDANPQNYSYGFNEYFGYGSPNSGGNQGESAWNAANRTAAFTEVPPAVTPGMGVGGSSALLTTFDTSNIQSSAIQDATDRFGDTSVDYVYFGGSTGTGKNPSAQITTTDLSQISFSLDAAFQGVASAGSSLRVDISFNPGPGDTLRYRVEFDIPTTPGFNTYTGTFDTFVRTLGTDDLIDESYTNLNFNIELVDAYSRFGGDSGNSVSIDNVRIDQIPEPSSALLVALGIVSAGLIRKRRA